MTWPEQEHLVSTSERLMLFLDRPSAGPAVIKPRNQLKIGFVKKVTNTKHLIAIYTKLKQLNHVDKDE
jgi:hypothetical protein